MNKTKVTKVEGIKPQSIRDKSKAMKDNIPNIIRPNTSKDVLILVCASVFYCLGVSAAHSNSAEIGYYMIIPITMFSVTTWLMNKIHIQFK